MMKSMLKPDLEPEVVAELANRLDAGAVVAVDAHALPDSLKLSEEDKKGPLGTAAMAFNYKTRRQHKGDRSAYFQPVFTWSDGRQFPPPIKDLPPEVGALWAAVAVQASEPLVRARLYDMCFEGHWGNRSEVARCAIEAYLAIGEERFGACGKITEARWALGGTVSLQRALDLARKIGDDALAQRAINAMVGATQKTVSGDHPSPGVALQLIQTLAADRGTVPELNDLLSQARSIFQGDVWHTELIIGLQLSRSQSDAETTARLQREDVEGWLAEAEKSQGIARLKHLETAVRKAQNYGLTEFSNEITKNLQEISPDELGLVRREFRVGIPSEAIEGYMAYFTDAASWQEALERLIIIDPPSGNVASNRDRVEKVREEAPFYSLATHVRIGGDGLPRFTAVSDEQREEWLLAQQELLSLDLYAGLVAEVLRRVWSKWGPIAEGELTTFLGQRGHVPSSMLQPLARSFLRHFMGDVEGAAFTLVPKIEALVRSIVLQCEMPVYRIQRQKKPGQYPGLGALLPVLAKIGIDESWIRFLHTFLASVAGFNERNELLHGFIDDIGEPTSALVVLAALYLTVGLQLVSPAGGLGSV